MAEAAISLVVEKLYDLLIEEEALLHGVRDDIAWMETELRRMQCFLHDADSKNRKTEDESVTNWVREIRDAAYEVEDVIDAFMLKSDGRRRQRKGFVGSIERYASTPFLKLKEHHDMGMKITKIKNKISSISNSRSTYGIQRLSSGDHGSSRGEKNLQERRQLALYNSDKEIVGLENDVKEVKNLLLNEESRCRLVVPIIGMGGLGKTTLAKQVYDSVDRGEFACRAWINVSQEYSIDEILMGVGEQVMGKKVSAGNVREQLKKFLDSRRYLIVMDDVWETDVWDFVRVYFPEANNGSRVMITSRDENVGLSAVPCFPPYRLQGLSFGHSWELFTRKVFSDKMDVERFCTRKLKDLAEKLVRGCGGLPLALVLLGGLLAGKEKSPSAWLRAVGGANWKQKEGGKVCMDILGLSYGDLPPNLKWCFLYFSSLPEDYKIGARKLIRLWIAEGFVRKRDGDETVEEIAEGYLEELNQRCMIQIAERNSYGSLKTCSIHDLLRDLAIKEAKEANFMDVAGNVERNHLSHPTVRRRALHSSATTAAPAPHLRTLLVFKTSCLVDLEGYKFLRVLDLENSTIKKLPKEIGLMIHLRYLGLRGSLCESLPSSIPELRNLQTLDLRGTTVSDVPSGFWKIESLRHVYFNPFFSIQPRISCGNLKNLQTLHGVESGPWVDTSSTKMNNLRVLNLYGSLDCYKCHELPANLTQVELMSTNLKQESWTLLEKLQCLRVLVLQMESYVGEQMICTSDGFPQLHQLVLMDLGNLKWWVVEDGAMPCLMRLSIWRCQKLETLPEGLQQVTTLQELNCFGMPKEFEDGIQSEGRQDRCKIQLSQSWSFCDLELE